MAVVAIVGANFGDEGKGRIVDALAAHSDYVVRFQGGPNAGHTVLNERGKFVLSQVPCGVFSPHAINVLGPGVALDPLRLCAELDMLAARGVPPPRLAISNRAQLLLSYHRLLDQWEEERLAEHAFGSTRSGIAPFFADKYSKLGILAQDLFEPERLRARIAAALVTKNVLAAGLYGKPPFTVDRVAEPLSALAERLKPYVCDSTALLREAVLRDKDVLLEGQLGALKDPDHGTHPFVTSSSTLAGFASVGAGIAPRAIRRIIAVTKAYSSTVGAGPFVTDLIGADGDELRRRGGDAGEYGAVTGRPRRVGWFDAVATRYGCELQGATEVALTCLDVLGYLEEIPICVGYRLGRRTVQEFPSPRELADAEPVFDFMPGWRCSISTARSRTELPAAAARYVDRLETLLGLPIKRVSVGPERDAMVDA